MDFFDIKPKREQRVLLRSLAEYAHIKTDAFVTDTGLVLGGRQPHHPLERQVVRGALQVGVCDIDGDMHRINVARAVYAAFGDTILTDNDVLYRRDGDVFNTSIENLVLNDVKQTAGWLEQQTKNNERLTAARSKRCALKKDNEWRIFSSIGQAMSWLRREGYTTSKKINRLAENAQHNTNSFNHEGHKNKRAGSVYRNYGYLPVLIDQLSDKHKNIIESKAKN